MKRRRADKGGVDVVETGSSELPEGDTSGQREGGPVSCKSGQLDKPQGSYRADDGKQNKRRPDMLVFLTIYPDHPD